MSLFTLVYYNRTTDCLVQYMHVEATTIHGAIAYTDIELYEDDEDDELRACELIKVFKEGVQT